MSVSSYIPAIPSPISVLGTVHYAISDQINSKVSRRFAVFSFRFDLITSFIFCAGVARYSAILVTSVLSPYVSRAILGVCVIFFTFIGQLALSVKYWNCLNEFNQEQMRQVIANSKGQEKQALLIETSIWNEPNSPMGDLKSLEFIPGFKMFIDLINSLAYSNDFRRNCQSLKNTHTIQHIKVRSEAELLSALDRLRTKSIDVIVLSGHGNSRRICLGKDFFIDQNSRALMKKIAEKTKDSASLILESCSTGKGSSNIAKTISTNCPNLTVYAPEKDISSILSKSVSSSSYVPEFWGPGGWPKKITTRVYQNGNLQEPPSLEVR